MVDEAQVFMEGVEKPVVRQFTVANGNSLSKGIFMIYSNASRTAVRHNGESDVRPLGVTTSSKDASDGNTEIGCQRTGVVIAVADGVITTGDLVKLGTVANRVIRIDPGALSRYQEMNSIIGRALTSATQNNTVRVALTLG